MSKISELSDGGSLQSTDYLIAVRSGGNVKVQADGNLSLGALTLTGLAVDGDAVFTTGDAVRLNTSDGADNGVLAITGGGANSDARGARVRLYGNEHASLGGILDIGAGNVSGGHIYSYTNAKLRQKIDYNGDISFYEDTGTTPKFFWDASAESLGIGTTSPATRLEVKDNSSNNLSTDIRLSQGYNSAYSQISSNFGGSLTIDAGVGAATPTLHFRTNGSERMRIDSSGNLLVGTTSVFTGAGIVPKVTITNSAGLGINGIGLLDVGFATRPSADHSYYAGFFLNNAGAGVGSISCTASATAYNTSSDARLKENIADAEDAGAKVDAIQVRQFDWKADGSHQDYGMIAQELLTVAPEAVSGDPESDDMMGVDYSKLVPMMLKEIQSLRARVAQLEGV